MCVFFFQLSNISPPPTKQQKQTSETGKNKNKARQGKIFRYGDNLWLCGGRRGGPPARRRKAGYASPLGFARSVDSPRRWTSLPIPGIEEKDSRIRLKNFRQDELAVFVLCRECWLTMTRRHDNHRGAFSDGFISGAICGHALPSIPANNAFHCAFVSPRRPFHCEKQATENRKTFSASAAPLVFSAWT